MIFLQFVMLWNWLWFGADGGRLKLVLILASVRLVNPEYLVLFAAFYLDGGAAVGPIPTSGPVGELHLGEILVPSFPPAEIGLTATVQRFLASLFIWANLVDVLASLELVTLLKLRVITFVV